MYCKYCGKKLEDNEICSCPGAQAEAAANAAKASQAPAGAPAGPGVQAVPKALLAKVAAGILIVVVLAALAAFALANKSTTVDLKKYVQVAFSGMNMAGTADVSVDWAALEEDALGDSQNSLGDAILLEASIQVDAAPLEGLSNGDTVTVTVSCDENTADRMKLKFINTSLDFPVSGLVDGVEADAFADLEMRFEGIAPYGTATVINNSEDSFVKTISYAVEPASGLSNGDTVTVTAQYSEYSAQEALRYVPETTKTFTVVGLDEYLTSYDQLDEDTLAKVTQQSKDVINTDLLSDTYTYAAAAYDSYYGYNYEKDSIVLKDVSLLSTYFAASKPDTNNSRNNLLIQVFQITATDNTNSDGVTFYYAVGYSDFLRNADGGVEVKLADTYTTCGHPTTDGIYNEVIAPLTSTYTVTQA